MAWVATSALEAVHIPGGLNLIFSQVILHCSSRDACSCNPVSKSQQGCYQFCCLCFTDHYIMTYGYEPYPHKSGRTIYQRKWIVSGMDCCGWCLSLFCFWAADNRCQHPPSQNKAPLLSYWLMDYLLLSFLSFLEGMDIFTLRGFHFLEKLQEVIFHSGGMVFLVTYVSIVLLYLKRIIWNSLWGTGQSSNCGEASSFSLCLSEVDRWSAFIVCYSGGVFVYLLSWGCHRSQNQLLPEIKSKVYHSIPPRICGMNCAEIY